MARQVINVGGAPNDGTGDPIRTAFGKVNSNSAELYSGFIARNNAAPADPGPANDNTQGYGLGSMWFNTNAIIAYLCTDATTGVAKWTRLDWQDGPGYVPGNWYLPYPITGGTGVPLSVGLARFIPWMARQTCTVNALGVRLTTVGTSNIQLALYGADPATKKPTGNPLAVTANINNTAGTVVNGAINQQVGGGQLLWLGINCGDATAVFSAGSGGIPAALIGDANQTSVGGATPWTNLSTPLAFGTWGDLTAAAWTTNANNAWAMIEMRIGSVP
jgi:hypothetical protein